MSSAVTIVDYNPHWPQSFRAEEQRIRSLLGERALAVEHIGSTAIPGLAAKPVIDIVLVVRDSADERGYAPALDTPATACVSASRSGTSIDCLRVPMPISISTCSRKHARRSLARSGFGTGCGITRTIGSCTRERKSPSRSDRGRMWTRTPAPKRT